MNPPAAAPRIPALDGWRAISILMVVWGHLVNYRFGSGEFSMVAGYLAVLGVKVFFVISGYLITGLALNEESRSGTLSIKGFYRRRAFRILPAYFAYLALVLVLSLTGAIRQDVAGVAQAAAFVCNAPGVDCGWFVGHSWSLAYEEQFYLLFPLLFLLTPRARKASLFTAIHLVLAVSPIVTLLLLPRSPSWESFRVMVSHFGCISAGVLFACRREQLTALGLRHHRLISISAAGCVLACLALASGYIVHRGAELRNAIEALVLPLSIAWLIYQTTVRPGRITACLDLPPVRYIGKISFSLYLWQQMFTSPTSLGDLSVLWLLPTALASYHFIEQPMVKLGRRNQATSALPPAARSSSLEAR
ncbi:acyltransferase family protein [Sphaerotilaceae bacterium SBD11-9]